jgi:hypothetical protein
MPLGKEYTFSWVYNTLMGYKQLAPSRSKIPIDQKLKIKGRDEIEFNLEFPIYEGGCSL